MKKIYFLIILHFFDIIIIYMFLIMTKIYKFQGDIDSDALQKLQKV